jgi:hypothetical protein
VTVPHPLIIVGTPNRAKMVNRRLPPNREAPYPGFRLQLDR